MTIRHSISWWCFANQMPPEKLISSAVELGFDGIELVDQEHWDAIRDAGLDIAAVVGHESLGDGLNKAGNHDRIEREIVKNLKLAEKYAIRNLICFSGNRHGESDERGIDVTADGLRRVAKAAEEADVYLVVELLNSKVNHVGYQCDRTAWGVEVVKRVGSPRVKLLYDIYHMQIMEGDLIRTSETTMNTLPTIIPREILDETILTTLRKSTIRQSSPPSGIRVTMDTSGMNLFPWAILRKR